MLKYLAFSIVDLLLNINHHYTPLQSFKITIMLTTRLKAALSSATQHTMPPEFGRKWGTECLNTRFPLPTLVCAGYRVKLIFMLTTLEFTVRRKNVLFILNK